MQVELNQTWESKVSKRNEHVYQMDESDEYSLHYEFLDRIPKADKYNVAALMWSMYSNLGTLSILTNQKV